MVGASCARCRVEIAIHLGRPRIVDGRVETLCAACWELRDHPLVVEDATIVDLAPPPPPPPPRSRARKHVALAVTAAIGVAGLVVATHSTNPAGAIPVLAVDTSEEPRPANASARHEPAPPAIPEPVLPERDGEPIDAWYPTLRDWIHPVTDAPELVPARAQRRFGALRENIEREECGHGHCGVDLDGPRGRPVVAVAWGTVVRVEQREHGKDGKTGRYVRIEHPDGVFTAYMHLDEIAPGLAHGDEVEAGQVIGTLGKTAIFNGEPHLHFSLQVTEDGGTRFIDPSPFLARSRVVPIPARAKGQTAPADRSQW
jgi:murein DD-endopeptidase MepM/ murein hydrolase activator NlpD